MLLHIMGSARRSNCTQCPRSRTLADVPYISVRDQSCASVRMISNLASKYRSVLDRFENNKSRQVIQYPLTSTIPSGVYPKHIYNPQMLHLYNIECHNRKITINILFASASGLSPRITIPVMTIICMAYTALVRSVFYVIFGS